MLEIFSEILKIVEMHRYFKIWRLNSGRTRAALTVLLCAGLAWGTVVQAANKKSTAFLADAQVLFDKADFPSAVIQARNALQADESSLPARVLLGRILIVIGDVAGAEVTLTDALNAGANRADVVVPLAQAMAMQGKQKLVLTAGTLALGGLPVPIQQKLMLIQASAHADLGDLPLALKTIAAARSLDPNSPDVWFAEVPIRVRLAQFKEAEAAVVKATALNPTSAEAYYFRGSVFHIAGKIKEARAAYDLSIIANPRHLGALIARAGLLIDVAEYKGAKADLLAIQEIAPDHPLALYLRALMAERENRPNDARNALRELTDLLDQIPLDFIRYKPQVLMLNGLAHYGLGRSEKAKQYFEMFVKTQPDAPIAKPLAQIYLRSRNFDLAVSTLEPFLKAHPTDSQAQAMLGTALMSKGQYARAADLMESAIRARDVPALHTVLGMSLLGGGNTASAIKELELALQRDPGQNPAALQLITYYQREKQFAKAVALAENLVKQQPQNAGYANLLGMAKGNAGDLPGARKALEQAVKVDPQFGLPLLNLARIDMANRQLDSAETRLQQLLKLDPKNAEAQFEMANLSRRRGRPVAVQNWLEQATASSGPRETRWGLALSDFHLRNGNAAQALAVAKNMSAKANDELDVLLALARAHIALKDAANARSNLLAATKAADFKPVPQVEIAQMQLGLGNFGGATYSLDKALSDQPDYLPALALQVVVLARQGDNDKAAQRARALVAKYPKRAAGYDLLGDMALTKNQRPEALDAYKRAHTAEPGTATFLKVFNVLALQKDSKPASDWAAMWLKTRPADTVASNALGNFYARNGDFAAAKTVYEEVVKTTPSNAEALNNLANTLLQLKNPDAVRVAELALENNPLNASLMDTLGWALLQNGQKERALGILKEARRQAGDNPEIKYHFAAALAQSGLKNDARDELTAALKISNQFAGAADAAKLLQTLK